MKHLLLLSLAAVALLSSCMMPMDGYSEPLSSGTGYSSDGYYSRSSLDSDYSSSYYPRSSVTTGFGYSSYGGGYRHSNCSHCGHCPCTCRSSSHYSSRHDDDCHDDHRHSSSSRSSSSRSSSSDTKWRYSGSVGRGDTKPVGNHDREWFKERGYDLKKLKKVD